MANTYTQIYIQAIFAVKYRNAVLDKGWRDKVFATIGNLINESGASAIIVNGVEDHVHTFFTIKPTLTISKILQSVKGKSSKYINESYFLQERFEWQEGFGAFSYSQSQINAVSNYIKNQEKHHKQKTFQQEYIDFLNKFKVDYNEDYLFKELQ